MKRKKMIWIVGSCTIVVLALSLSWVAAGKPTGFIDTARNLAGFAPLQNSLEESEPALTETPGITIKREYRKQDVATIIRSLKTVSTFNGYFRSTGVATEISPKSGVSYTIFAPSNGAFAQLPVGTVGSMTSEEKLRLIEHHVVKDRVVDVGNGREADARTLSRDVLDFGTSPDGIPMVDSAIVITQYVGTNGVVIVVDNVLLPPKR
jgi:uncharacterized surface protein with fasciclin (FAS1) repeats